MYSVYHSDLLLHVNTYEGLEGPTMRMILVAAVVVVIMESVVVP